MGLDPSTRFALKEQGEDGLVDTADAKSAERQELLGERTGRLTQDAKAMLKAAGVPTAGVRGKKKIEEAWMKYRENMAKKEGEPSSIFSTPTSSVQAQEQVAKAVEESPFIKTLGLKADSSIHDVEKSLRGLTSKKMSVSDDELMELVGHIKNSRTADPRSFEELFRDGLTNPFGDGPTAAADIPRFNFILQIGEAKNLKEARLAFDKLQADMNIYGGNFQRDSVVAP